MQRLTLSLITVVLLAFLGLGWVIDHWYSLRAPADETVLSRYKLLAGEIHQQLKRQHLQLAELQNWAAQAALEPQITIYQDFPIPSNLAPAFEQGEPLLLDSDQQISLHYFLPDSNSVLSFNLPLNEKADTNTHLKLALTLGFYGGVIGLLLIWLMPLLRRLALLRSTAEAVGRGELQRRIPQTGVSYIRDIEASFNAMAARLEHLIQDNKILSRGLSHDLRTPLARLRFGLDVLAENTPNPEQLAMLEHLNRDLLDMEVLVETLLDYSKLEEANIRLECAPVNIRELLQDLISSSYGPELKLELPPLAPAIIQGHADYLTMLLHNIFQNALRYGDGIVHVSLQQTVTEWVLTVEDNGPGIPLSERQHVLMPFYRATNRVNIKGHGLGLALVARIAHWHNAALILEESPSLGGLLIQVSFAKSQM